MAKVRAITGASADEFADLTRKAKELGLETAQTMTDIAAGMEAFGRAGFSATEIISAMDGAVALAESQVMDLGEAVGITANILRGMRLEASESERVVNALAAAASSSNTTVGSLAESMKYLAPIMADLNIPLEEGLAIIGKLGDAGLTGTMATRALATAFTRLADPTSDMKKAMEELNIEFFDARGNFIGLTPMIALLEDRFAGLTQEQRSAAISTLFGAEALKHFSILLGVGAEDITAYTDKITGTTKAFDQQAEMLNTLSGQWQILKGSVELLLVTIGIDMMPILKTFLKDRIIPIVNNMTSWIEKMGGLKGIFAALKGKVRDWAREHELLISAFVRGKDAVVRLWHTVVDAFRTIVTTLGYGSDEADTFGADFESALTVAINIVTTLVGGVTKFVKFLADHGRTTIAIIAGIGAAFIAWKVSLIVTSLTTVATGLWGMATAAGAAIAAGGWIALLIAGMGLLAYRTIKHWDEIKEAGVGKWAGIIGMPTDAQWLQWAKDLWNGFLGILPDNADWLNWGISILNGIIGALNWMLDGLTAWMPNWMREWFHIGELSAIAIGEGIESKTDVIETAGDALVKTTEEIQAEVLETTQDYLGQERILTLDHLTLLGAARKKAGDEREETHRDGLANILRAEEQFQADTAASHEEHHEDEIEAEGTFWDDFIDVVRDSGAEVGNVMADMWDSLKSLAKSALGDTLNGIVDHFRDQRRLAEEHADRMLDIEEDYNQDAADLQYTRQDDSKDAELSYQRRVEDIERRYRRELQGITGEDTEERARIETRYREDMEDATTNYARRREDIEEDYSDAVIAQERRREQALADERQEYKDTQKSLWGVLGDMLHDLLTALREELFVKAASHAVEALAWSFIPPLFFLNPQAIGHAAAAAAFAAGGAGLAIAGFGEGAVFEQPTMIPPALVGESGYKEAFLPLSPSIFGEIGQGIVDALSVPTPAPVLVGAGGGTTINMDWRGLYDGATINVRDDQDITRIAREHFDLFRSRLRSKGRDIG